MNRFSYRPGDMVTFDGAFGDLFGDQRQTMWCCDCATGPPSSDQMCRMNEYIRCNLCPKYRVTFGHARCWKSKNVCPICCRARQEQQTMPLISPTPLSSSTPSVIRQWPPQSTPSGTLLGNFPSLPLNLPLFPDMSCSFNRFAKTFSK